MDSSEFIYFLRNMAINVSEDDMLEEAVYLIEDLDLEIADLRAKLDDANDRLKSNGP